MLADYMKTVTIKKMEGCVNQASSANYLAYV
jgi:hypothetical protein